MAVQSQSVLCRRLAEAYADAVSKGKDKITIHVNWVADILDYLDPEDTSQSKVRGAYLDDQAEHIIERYIEQRKKDGEK